MHNNLHIGIHPPHHHHTNDQKTNPCSVAQPNFKAHPFAKHIRSEIIVIPKQEMDPQLSNLLYTYRHPDLPQHLGTTLWNPSHSSLP